MKKKIDVNKVNLRLDLYPRLKVVDSKVQEYKEVLSLLPLIIVNQDNILIDGAHRLQAFKDTKQKEIEVEIIHTKDDDDILLKAIELNAKHGFQLTRQEKRKQVISLYQKILKGESKSFDVNRLKETFSIPNSTFSDWTKDLNDSLEAQLLEKILNLHLQCKTQEEIAEIVGITQKQISIKIDEITKNIKILYQNPISEIGIKYEFLREKMEVLAEFKPQLYNIWNISKMNNETSHFGNVPVEFQENLLYYYTKPFDVIYDPFGGGGSTIDACEKFFRKYCVYDRLPKETRPEIKKWDIKEGLPKDLPNNIKLVYLDPPYWKQAEGKYSKDKDDLANMDLEKFYSSLVMFVKNVKKKLVNNGKIALIIGASQWCVKDYERIDHIIDLIEVIKKLGFKVQQRFVCPYNSEIYNGNQVNIAKEKKICLNIYRDLVVFEKI